MSEEETYTPSVKIVEEKYNKAIKNLEKVDGSIHPVIDIADKYFASKPKEVDYYLYDMANNILSDMSLMSHLQKSFDGTEELGEFNGADVFYEPLRLMLKHSNKLLLYMIVEVKSLINGLTKNTSNISHLFHNGERKFIITEVKYCIPIIETHMENPCYKHDFGKVTNKLIQIQYDLLERLENQLTAKIADDNGEDKHTWIAECLSYDSDDAVYDNNLKWRKNLDAFYKVRDEQIQNMKDENEERERQLKIKREKLQSEYEMLQRRTEKLKKLIAENEKELAEGIK